MIRFTKIKDTDWEGKPYYLSGIRKVAGHPEYTLEYGAGCGTSWALYKGGGFVRTFKNLDAARKYLTEEFERKKATLKRIGNGWSIEHKDGTKIERFLTKKYAIEWARRSGLHLVKEA